MFSRLKNFCLSYLSKPAIDRSIDQLLRQRRVLKILEIGIGDAERAKRLIQLAQKSAGGEMVHYIAIDPFESRTRQTASLTLKEAYRRLKPSGARVQLIPGDPRTALVHSANSLQHVDLMIISAEHDAAALAGAWFYVPRMLHPQSLVYDEVVQPEDKSLELRPLSLAEIAGLAAAHRPRRAA